jgi:hypothetical protein
MQIELLGSTGYGQNLDVKELTGRNFEDLDPKWDDAVLAHRHGLDYDCAIGMVGARSDVTRGLWKSTDCGFEGISLDIRYPPPTIPSWKFL